MDVTKKLMEEHQLILGYIGILQNFAQQWLASESEDQGYFTKLEAIIGFIQNYADSYHHAKEEDILFRHMEEPGVLSHCNPLPVMLSDHEIGRSHVRAMLHAIAVKDRGTAINHVLAWAEHLSNHIYKEDNVLYVMAEEGLSQEAKVKIKAAYDEVEKSHGGPELDLKYQNLLKTLTL